LSDRTTPPAPDEVEVSIFGPGKGESIAVHVGGGEWIIVDSCVDQETKEIPVLQYLQGIGVDLSTEVKLVVGTHAHDDHIAGLGEVFAACETATFVCSSALTREEFLRDIKADAQIEQRIRSSIRREYRRIFDVVKTRPTGVGLKWAIQERKLITRQESTNAPAMQVLALSPSDIAVERARGKLARLADVDPTRRLSSIDPNELAVALSVVVGDTAVLLGADLKAGPTGCGWGAVLATFTLDPKASVFKVPHHGSENAHHDDVWSQLVTAEVISLLAPFGDGRKPLPSPADVGRLKDLSKAVYCSANPKGPTPSKAVRKTGAALTGLATNVRTIGYSGQVRARKVCGTADWEVETFKPAMQL
jgi:beta-lactamase superfamily II metal-dependent hydrolase